MPRPHVLAVKLTPALVSEGHLCLACDCTTAAMADPNIKA